MYNINYMIFVINDTLCTFYNKYLYFINNKRSVIVIMMNYYYY